MLWAKTLRGSYEMTVVTPLWQRTLSLRVWGTVAVPPTVVGTERLGRWPIERRGRVLEVLSKGDVHHSGACGGARIG